MAFGKKSDIIADQKETIAERDKTIADWESRFEAAGDYLPLAIALKKEVEVALGSTAIRDDAYETAREKVKVKAMEDELAMLAEQLEPEIADEVRAQVREEVEGNRGAIKAKMAAELHESGVFSTIAEEEEQRLRDMLSEEVRSEERTKIDEDILARSDEIKEEERNKYVGSEEYEAQWDQKLQEARAKVRELTIDEVLADLEGQAYEAARQERADQLLSEEQNQGRLDRIAEKAHEKRKLEIADLQPEDLLWVHLGTYRYTNEDIYEENRYSYGREKTGTRTVRSYTTHRKLKLSVVDPEKGTCMVLQDTLADDENPYTRNDAFDDGEEIRIGTFRKGRQPEPFVAELREDVVAAYCRDDTQTEPTIDSWGVCQITVVVNGKSTDLFVKKPGAQE